MDNKKLPQIIKWTKQRKAIYEVLSHAEKPLSAQDIYQEILRDEKLCETVESGFAISTVYRTLSVFEENHLVEKSVLLGSDTAIYELCEGEGEHKHYAVCLSCHKLVALKKCPIEHIKTDSIESNDDDFVVTGHKLELYGYCKDCSVQ